MNPKTKKQLMQDLEDFRQRVAELEKLNVQTNRASETFKKKEARFAAFVESSRIGIIFMDIKGTVTYRSPSMVKITGYNNGERLNRNVFDLVHPEDRPALQGIMDKALLEKEWPITAEYRIQHKDGSWRWVEGTFTNLLEHGNVQEVVVTTQDIMERKRIEELLRDSEEKYKALVETTGTGYLILNPQGKVLDANQEYLRLAGFKALDEIIGRNILEWTADYDQERNAAAVSQCLQQGNVHNLEIDYVDKQGRITPVEIHATVLKKESSIQITSLCHDISTRKKTEYALRFSQEMLSKAFKASPNWISISTWTDGRYIDVSDRFLQLTGHLREEVIGFSSFEIGLWENPYDRRRALNLLGKEGRLKDFELNFRMKSGEIRNFLWSAEMIVIDGERCLVSACQDITRRKQMEDALQLSEEKYQLLVNNASIGIMVSQDFRVMYANPKAAEMAGYSQEELYNKPLLELVHPDYHAYSRDRIIRRVKGENLSTFTLIKGIKKNGGTHWLDMGVVPNLWEGKPAFLYFYQDVTEVKAAREELLKAKSELESRVAERTTVLHGLNKQLKKELAERKMIEAARKKSEKNLRVLSNRLINAQENERKRIAYELHDDLGQSLVGLKIHLSRLKKKFNPAPDYDAQDFDKALVTINKITEDVRQISRELRPAVLEHLGLYEALQWLCEDFSGKYSIQISNAIPNIHFPLSKEQEVITFRIFQEGLANIGKHSRATKVSLSLALQNKSIIFGITDNGKGFDLHWIKTGNPLKAGLGLTAMKERALMAGGSIEITSEKGKGTRITFSIKAKQTGRPREDKP
ncbi:MAG TPA: PAS domain S-box protein [Thermodesulfobacteriota bacterium]|nr:PAS domain S-box protein [Thermodesulfobacteriota bacterium]